MRTALTRAILGLLAGFAVVIVDFRINGVDLLPDFVGYALAAVSVGFARERAGLHPSWSILAVIAFAFAATLAIPGSLVETRPPPGNGLRVWYDPAWPLALAVGTLAQLGLVTTLLAVLPLARRVGAATTTRRIERTILALVVLMALGFLFGAAVNLTRADALLVLAVLLAVVDAVASIWALYVLWCARHLDAAAPPPRSPPHDEDEAIGWT